jgi:hypothetical protein
MATNYSYNNNNNNNSKTSPSSSSSSRGHLEALIIEGSVILKCNLKGIIKE